MSDILDEHNKIPEQNFPTPPLNGTNKIGKISLKDGEVVDVYKKQHQNQIQYIAAKNNVIFGFVNLVSIPARSNLLMAKNAQSYIKGKNVLLNLLLFCKKNTNSHILSDIEMSDSGEEAWFKIIKNPRINAKIYNFELDKIYNLDDSTATKPEKDIQINSNDINWFYMIESVISTKFDQGIIDGLCLPNYYD